MSMLGRGVSPCKYIIRESFGRVSTLPFLIYFVVFILFIWTAIAFDAHVLKWTLDNNPPDEYARHHIKEASFYDVDTWNLDLVIKIPDSGRRSITVNYVGIKEKAMWPGKMKEKAEGGRAMALFEDLDNWLEAGTVDATLLGCVGGSVDV
jgi:hypothetical protein